MYSDFQMIQFDPGQKKAVRHVKGPMLVLAGPGSGKTTVLTHRILYLKSEAKIPETEILVLTFTRAAAAEMKERYLRLADSRETKVTFGTFHSVFYRILRQYTEIGNCEICERPDALAMIGQILCKRFGEEFSPGTVCEEVYDQIGRMKNGMKVSASLPKEVYSELEEAMRRNGKIDYDDMLLKLLRMLTDDPEILRMLRSRYRYILVDEFQDLNRTQYEILKLLAGTAQNVFAVGDDDQSIYGFRGSDPGFMKQFLNDYRSAKKIVLSANHRSTGEIVKASVRLIRHNRNRFAKKLHSVNTRGLRPDIRTFEDPEEEAKYIEQRIKVLREAAEKSGLTEPTAAILARTSAVLKDVTGRMDPAVSERISTMTFHGCKGLEFDAVFIVGAAEGIAPDRRSLADGSEEEERRAFYVAMTRARKYLHIFNTKTLYNKPVKSSEYIKEIKSFI